MRFAFQISGKDAAGNNWSAQGVTANYQTGQFDTALHDAQMQAFMQITHGKALFGKPGVACRGPYKITRLCLEELPPAQEVS